MFKLFLYFVYFCAVAALSVWLYFSCIDVSDLYKNVSNLKTGNALLRDEILQLDRKIDSARGRVGALIGEQKRLEEESERLKAQALELETMWETARQCKKEFEELSAEIDTLKQQIANLKSNRR